MKIQHIVKSWRPRTLPLSVSGIILGSSIAWRADLSDGQLFSWPVFAWALITTLSLQILCNLANELGDSIKGTDNENRLGPKGILQSGDVSIGNYRKMIVIFSFLSVGAGLCLLYSARGSLFHRDCLIMMGCGAAALIAAITYTIGKRPYGYRGLGDISVFIFFGLLSTCGSYFLLRPFPEELLLVLLPAASAGCLITGVLNVNNLRDYENDAKFGKNTLVVRNGAGWGRKYHYALVLSAWILMLAYTWLTYRSCFDLLYLLSLPLFVRHLQHIRADNGRQLDPQLKALSLTTLLFCILFAGGMVLGCIL